MVQNTFKKIAIVFCLLLFGWSLVLPDTMSLAAPQQPTSTCNSYLLCDFTTGEIIFANKPNERVYPASVTKMMTALILIEKKPDLSEKVKVGSEINNFGPEASRMGLLQNELISYKDLLYGMLLVSGNDAAATVAVNIGGSINGFAELMNQKAAELGMVNSHFVNPHGMHSEEHYTTTADLAKLAIACMKNAVFADVVKTAVYTTSPTNKKSAGRVLETTNRLISPKDDNKPYHYDAAIGIKTGSTTAAQGCLVSAAQKNGRTLIAVMMGDDSVVNNLQYAKRWTDSVKFFDYGFGLTRVELSPYIAKLSTVGTLSGSSSATLYAAPPASLGYWTDDSGAAALSLPDAITVKIQFNGSFTAYSPSSHSIGTAVYSYGEQELYRVEISLTPSDVKVQSSQSAAPSKTIKIILWALAFLLCFSLLFFIIMIRRLHLKRRRRSKKPASSHANSNTNPLPYQRTSYNGQSRQIRDGSVRKPENTANRRVPNEEMRSIVRPIRPPSNNRNRQGKQFTDNGRPYE